MKVKPPKDGTRRRKAPFQTGMELDNDEQDKAEVSYAGAMKKISIVIDGKQNWERILEISEERNFPFCRLQENKRLRYEK